MSAIIFEPIANPDPNGQTATLHYNGGSSITKFKTESGLEASLIPDARKSWFKVVDGGDDCLYGRWINTPHMDPAIVQKTGKIISVTTEDGVTTPTLAMVRFSDPQESDVQGVSGAQMGARLAAALGAAVRGVDPDQAIKEALEDEQPLEAKRRTPGSSKGGHNLN